MSVLLSVLLTGRTWAQSRAAVQLEDPGVAPPTEVLQGSRPQRLHLATMDRWLWVVMANC
jgi:hypothetical protein